MWVSLDSVYSQWSHSMKSQDSLVEKLQEMNYRNRLHVSLEFLVAMEDTHNCVVCCQTLKAVPMASKYIW